MLQNTKNSRNIHDITFRGLLRHSLELSNLLNNELNLTEPILSDNIKYIDAQFIDDTFHSKDSDLICEVENKDNIFLIEHQSTVNSIMPIRILNYTRELVKEISQGQRCNKVITPIIVYTGQRKWNVEKYIGELSQKILASQNVKIGEYILLDMNKYSIEELLNQKGAFYKIVLLDRFINANEIFDIMDMIDLTTLDKNEQKILYGYAKGVLLSIVGEKKVKQFIQNVDLKDGDQSMFMLAERLKTWYNDGIAQAEIKGKTHELLILAKKMLKDNMDIELIKRYTGFSTKQIEDLKKSM